MCGEVRSFIYFKACSESSQGGGWEDDFKSLSLWKTYSFFLPEITYEALCQSKSAYVHNPSVLATVMLVCSSNSMFGCRLNKALSS